MPGPDEIKELQSGFIEQNPEIKNALARMLGQPKQPEPPKPPISFKPNEIPALIQFEERNPSPLTQALIDKLLEEAKKHDQWPYPVVIANPDNGAHA